MALQVFPKNGAWAVRTRGASRCAKVGLTRFMALYHAFVMARRRRDVLYVHDEHGRISKKISYYAR